MKREQSDRVIIENPDVVKEGMKVQKAGTVYVGTALSGKRVNVVVEVIDEQDDDDQDDDENERAAAEAEAAVEAAIEDVDNDNDGDARG